MNKITISPAFVGFLRGLGTLVLFSVLSYIGVASHLTFLNPGTAAIVASIALWIEGALSPSGTALVGAVRVK